MQTVSEDGDFVAQVEDLLQPVAYEEHGYAAFTELAHNAEETVDLTRGERRCGLVHHQ